jgi:starch synthase
MKFIDFYPNVVHAHDWQSALSVIYLKTVLKYEYGYDKIKTMFTIHNIEYQGKYDLSILEDVFALDRQFENIVKYNDEINLTKGAVTVSDFVSTVSPNYANELKHDFFAFGLSNVICDASHKMCGIINGIDYSYFSPDVGGDIYSPYTRRAFKTGKAKNKKALQAELGLLQSPKTPLIVMISRLTDGKGIDLILHVIEELLLEEVQFAVLGTGEAKYEQAFRFIESNHANFKAVLNFDRVLSKKMYAGADIFLMPSKSEPCGLAQMIACSYGTVPVVRTVGGLADSIIPYGCDGANGFRFDNYNAHDLLYTAKSALNLYSSTKEWEQLVKSAINSNFSWDSSAQKYIGLYKNLLMK